MANKRIKDLSTTAAVTASDDFIAVDGATNGTRKLNAYSPTFGGNLTVSGGTVRFQDPTNSYGVTITTAAAKTLVETLFGGSSLGIRVGGSGSDSLTIASTGATIRDNLTVSGTVQIDGFSALFKTQTATLATIGSAYAAGHGSYRAEISFGAQNYGSTDAGYIGFRTSATYNTGTLSEVGRFAANGNLLLGTTTDSGNGKLQLATHTTSAGGIGFGTETSLYRYGGGIIGLDHIGGSVPGLTLLASGTRIISIYGASNSLYLDTFNAAGAMYLRTGAQTTALTLDASQNATFAGAVTSNTANASFTAKGNGGLGGYFLADGNLQDSWGSTAYHLVIKRGKNTSTQFRWNLATVDAEITPDSGAGCNLSFQYAINNGAWTEALKLDRTSNATFAGNIKTAAPSGGTAATWRLGTVASVSPTSPNRTIEVEIGGTTYYIHAKTTNN